MIRPSELIRIAVIRSSTLWPFSYINKIPYYLAIRLFIIINKNNKLIKGIYLRHGLTEANWIPGLSDIDNSKKTSRAREGVPHFKIILEEI